MYQLLNTIEYLWTLIYSNFIENYFAEHFLNIAFLINNSEKMRQLYFFHLFYTNHTPTSQYKRIHEMDNKLPAVF